MKIFFKENKLEKIGKNFQRSFAFKYLFNINTSYYLKSKTYGVLPFLLMKDTKRYLILKACKFICHGLNKIFDKFLCDTKIFSYEVKKKNSKIKIQ